MELRCKALPMVGTVLRISPMCNLYKIVVLPAASSPNMTTCQETQPLSHLCSTRKAMRRGAQLEAVLTRISLFPKTLSSIFLKVFPISSNGIGAEAPSLSLPSESRSCLTVSQKSQNCLCTAMEASVLCSLIVLISACLLSWSLQAWPAGSGQQITALSCINLRDVESYELFAGL